MIADEHVAVGDVVAVDCQYLCNEMAIDRRVEEHWRRDNQAAVPIQNHTGKVARLTDDGGIPGPVKMIMHLLHQAADAVAYDLRGNGIDHIRILCAQGSGCRSDRPARASRAARLSWRRTAR